VSPECRKPRGSAFARVLGRHSLMKELRRISVALWGLVVGVAAACNLSRYSGLLGSDAASLRHGASGWKCRTTTLHPAQVGLEPYRLCEGSVADTLVGVLSDRDGLVIEVARGWKPSTDPVIEFARLERALGDSGAAPWCDAVGATASRVWIGESAYTVLMLRATPSVIALHRALGKPYCRVHER